LHYSRIGISLGALSRAQIAAKPGLHEEFEMSRTALSAGQRARWRWLLYVVLAFAGGLLTFVGARAQQRASDDATFRRLIEGYCAAWSSGNAEAPARFYAKDNGLVFYDLAPVSYHGWKEYHDGVQR